MSLTYKYIVQHLKSCAYWWKLWRFGWVIWQRWK